MYKIICSAHDLYGVKPACSSVLWRSVCFLKHSRIMLSMIFLRIKSNMISLQLLQLVRSPFFGSLTLRSLFHWVSFFSSFHSLSKNTRKGCFIMCLNNHFSNIILFSCLHNFHLTDRFFKLVPKSIYLLWQSFITYFQQFLWI